MKDVPAKDDFFDINNAPEEIIIKRTGCSEKVARLVIKHRPYVIAEDILRI